MGLERPNEGAFNRDCKVMEEVMAEFLATILGVGVTAILIGMLRHWFKKREFEKRIASAMKRYDLINK